MLSWTVGLFFLLIFQNRSAAGNVIQHLKKEETPYLSCTPTYIFINWVFFLASPFETFKRWWLDKKSIEFKWRQSQCTWLTPTWLTQDVKIDVAQDLNKMWDHWLRISIWWLFSWTRTKGVIKDKALRGDSQPKTRVGKCIRHNQEHHWMPIGLTINFDHFLISFDYKNIVSTLCVIKTQNAQYW